jgi:LysR family transcriptional regulator for metE and metH
MQLEIRHLRLVAAIAELGSVTRAGNRLHLTQSALSHQLRDAEEQLGTPLFDRKNGKMTLTTAGERLLQSARSVLAELERAQVEIQEGRPGARGLIRLSTQCYTAYHWLPSRLKLFQEKFPAVDFQLSVDATSNPFAALLDGKLDVALAFEPIRNRKIRYTPLFEDELLVIVARGHRLAGKKYAAAEDLADENIIIYPPKEESTVLIEVLAPAGLSPRRVQEVMLTEVIIDMVRAGMGIATQPRWAVAPHLSSGEVIGLPLTSQGFYRTWSAAQLRDNHAPLYLQEFIRMLREWPISADFSERRMQAKKRGVGQGSRPHGASRAISPGSRVVKAQLQIYRRTPKAGFAAD